MTGLRWPWPRRIGEKRRMGMRDPFALPCVQGDHHIVDIGGGLLCLKCDAMKGMA